MIQRVVRGFPVAVVNTRRDTQTERVLARLDAALGLLERYVPHHYRRTRKSHLTSILGSRHGG